MILGWQLSPFGFLEDRKTEKFLLIKTTSINDVLSIFINNFPPSFYQFHYSPFVEFLRFIFKKPIKMPFSGLLIGESFPV